MAMHALIIEDEAIIAMAIEAALRELGFTSFDIAASVEGAIAAAGGRCPDLVTADVRLGVGCGIDAIETICSEKPIPVVFITATPADVQERCPDHVVLTKPFSPAGLAEAVQHVIAAL
jgi:CheY-like chemotaxis protein